MYRISALAAAIVLIAPFSAGAEPDLVNFDSTPPALVHLQESGVDLTYVGKDGGLEAYLGEAKDGSMQMFYLAPDGEHVLAGLLLRKDGVNVSGVQLGRMRERQLLAQAETKGVHPYQVAEQEVAREFLNEFSGAGWFHVGKSDVPVVYMIADPKCPYCHEAWKKLAPRVARGDFAVRVIVIAALSGSADPALALLSHNSPAELWVKGYGNTSMPIEEGPNTGVAEAVIVRNHSALMAKTVKAVMKETVTPYIFYGSGDRLLASDGVPSDLDVFLSEL